MGNPRNNNNTRVKNQAHKVQIKIPASVQPDSAVGIMSKEAEVTQSIPVGSGTSQGIQEETLNIPLNKLNSVLVGKLRYSDSVTLKFESGQYIAYFIGSRLGTVPPNFISQLQPTKQYYGTVFEIVYGTNPQVVISVVKRRK